MSESRCKSLRNCRWFFVMTRTLGTNSWRTYLVTVFRATFVVR